jgi:NAD(P)-dependent dehydrogenase (short-subunit alcohol dehydrogenase family)
MPGLLEARQPSSQAAQVVSGVEAASPSRTQCQCVRGRPARGSIFGRPTTEVIDAEKDASATYVEFDITEKADVESAVAAAEKFRGIDIMVNTVGQIERIHYDKDLLSFPEEGFYDMVELNLASVYFGSQVAGSDWWRVAASRSSMSRASPG